MEYNYEDVEKVINFSSWSDRKKIEELFRIDSYMYTNLGTDSLKKERDEVRKKSRYIYRAIAKIDPKTGKGLIYSMDS
ncbi:MAG: hypothetical protein QNK97_04465 [Gammaproteobacteria bacterium]|tara:strand:+ start:899 stop:1132 length:234 start_codon:yes stop_codon:yes gene_type:complete